MPPLIPHSEWKKFGHSFLLCFHFALLPLSFGQPPLPATKSLVEIKMRVNYTCFLGVLVKYTLVFVAKKTDLVDKGGSCLGRLK